MVEALTLQKAGRVLHEVCYPRVDGKNWQYTHNTTIATDADGVPTLEYADERAEQAILRSIAEPASEEQQANSEALFEEVTNTVAEGKLLQASEKPSFLAPVWMDFSMKDPELKMAVC